MFLKCVQNSGGGTTPSIDYGYLPVNGSKNFTVNNAYFYTVLAYVDTFDRQYVGKIENGVLTILHGTSSYANAIASYSNGVLTLSHSSDIARVAYTVISY